MSVLDLRVSSNVEELFRACTTRLPQTTALVISFAQTWSIICIIIIIIIIASSSSLHQQHPQCPLNALAEAASLNAYALSLSCITSCASHHRPPRWWQCTLHTQGSRKSHRRTLDAQEYHDRQINTGGAGIF